MPFQKGNPGKPKGLPHKKTLQIKDLCERVLYGDTPQRYIDNLRLRILAGEADHMEKFLAEHLWGKPRDILEVSGTVRLEHILMERLLSAKERALAEPEVIEPRPSSFYPIKAIGQSA